LLPHTFGIAIPSFCGREFIGRTLRSVVAQTLESWVCVVVNDGKDDGTRDEVRAIDDGRIHYICDGHRRGQFGNFNRAITEVLRHDVEHIRLLCSDDVLYPWNLQDMLRLFEEHPRVGLVAAHYDGIDADDALTFRVDMREFKDRVIKGRECPASVEM
jgi:glycosyltransferase involved in cell wall biosynthesis